MLASSLNLSEFVNVGCGYGCSSGPRWAACTHCLASRVVALLATVGAVGVRLALPRPGDKVPRQQADQVRRAYRKQARRYDRSTQTTSRFFDIDGGRTWACGGARGETSPR